MVHSNVNNFVFVVVFMMIKKAIQDDSEIHLNSISTINSTLSSNVIPLVWTPIKRDFHARILPGVSKKYRFGCVQQLEFSFNQWLITLEMFLMFSLING